MKNNFFKVKIIDNNELSVEINIKLKKKIEKIAKSYNGKVMNKGIIRNMEFEINNLALTWLYENIEELE